MTIGILGSGEVAKALAVGFIKVGHQVMVGSRSQEKLELWKQEIGPEIQTGYFAEAAAFGEMIVLAVRGSAAVEVLMQAGHNNLSGKIIIDPTNPIAETAPVNGVLTYFTDQNESLMERLQAAVPEARFVKAFNSIGSPFMVNPPFKITPTMFICGNDTDAKKTVHDLLVQFGWEVEDMGMVEAARAIEPLCILWCIPGMLAGQWTHAFRLVKLEN